jgi:hypothetical protein
MLLLNTNPFLLRNVPTLCHTFRNVEKFHEIHPSYLFIFFRFCHRVFDANYKATIGVDFELERFRVLDVAFNLQM